MTQNRVTKTVVAVVALVAGILSGAHIIALGLDVLPPGHAWQAWLAPVPIDGALLIASLSLADARRAGRKAGLIVWATLAVGVIGSIAANWSAAPDSFTGKALAVSAPIALALSVEILLSDTGKVVKTSPQIAPEPLLVTPEGEDTQETPKRLTEPLAVKRSRKVDPGENRRIAEDYVRAGVTPNRARVRADHQVGASRADEIARLVKGMTAEAELVPA